jgi:ABC-2 type transport system ATP-binding protein
MLIHLENISKTFKVAERGRTIKDVLKSFIRRRYKEIHAIKDISFDIKEGEIVRLHRAEWCR